MARSKKVNFEKSLSELETIVEQLEDSELSLEDSLKQFEKGIKLTRECQQALDEAEQRVLAVTEQQDGSASYTPFEQEEQS
ncbi:exodeoxyribonuclease VII small subunit [Sinobacterium caligoides]|uniref:Exodeoxyribonuclease 7 small subunit n=1 Tax=Sinobacterium caligoides TaxID=933926 RepID=A0A3N2DP72_9GAMM|nr:exodeoxyribonuclease VII small subunit [Sinobacterium caligoides]ROS01608.1 exodeoxyribonuclease VII small subunit [Sinobacterium caligoides]